jgi:hypothetical protein
MKFFNVELGLPTIFTLYISRKFLEKKENALDLLAIFYYTNHKNCLRKFKDKYLWQLSDEELEEFLNKDEDKIYLKLTIEALFNKNKIISELEKISNAFKINIEGSNIDFKDENEALEILIGSLLNNGLKLTEIYSMTLKELELRWKALKYYKEMLEVEYKK